MRDLLVFVNFLIFFGTELFMIYLIRSCLNEVRELQQ